MNQKDKQRKKAVFLANALSGYFVACLNKMTEEYSIDAHVVKYPVDAIAPFEFNLKNDHITYYDRNNFADKKLSELIVSINPDVILCSGWIDKGYLEVCKNYKGKIKTLLKFDNPWRNTTKQNLARVLGPLLLRKYFSGCWVSGQPQRVYAKKLGFKEEEICEGMYSADVDFFHAQYEKYTDAKRKSFPKKILYVGRYARLKGVEELWKAFTRFQEKYPCEWELWCLGKGDLINLFPQHEKIKNFGFVQPAEIEHFVAGTGVFILPAHYEHWGVVVHEYAAAGFPLICSTTTSAATAFLKDAYNGFYHKPVDVDSLVEVFRKISLLSNEELATMGERSAELAKQMTPKIWGGIVWKFITEEKLTNFRFNIDASIKPDKSYA
ncbi:MAG TPA: glycosyltransferase family 4 protein [Bacteroidia bacterium]|nr:glycosyltransferase family 4 protein [Bacteroidia bacterium]